MSLASDRWVGAGCAVGAHSLATRPVLFASRRVRSGSRGRAVGRLGRSGTVEVVVAAAFGVLEGLVRLVDEAEEQRIAVAVGVMRLGELAERRLDLVGRRLAADAQDLVVVEIGHRKVGAGLGLSTGAGARQLNRSWTSSSKRCSLLLVLSIRLSPEIPRAINVLLEEKCRSWGPISRGGCAVGLRRVGLVAKVRLGLVDVVPRVIVVVRPLIELVWCWFVWRVLVHLHLLALEL